MIDLEKKKNINNRDVLSQCDIIENMEVSNNLPEVSKKKSLNPKGLPESAQHRNRLGKAFISRMRADFQKHGIATIERLREKNPGHYLQLIANLIPNQVELNVNHTFMDLLREASEYHNNRNNNIIDVEVVRDEDIT